MLHRRFPEIKLSASSLHRLYKRHKIKFKLINKVKRHINFFDDPFKSQVIELQRTTDGLLKKGYELLYLDEAIFSFNTFNGRVWSHANTNFEVFKEWTVIKT